MFEVIYYIETNAANRGSSLWKRKYTHVDCKLQHLYPVYHQSSNIREELQLKIHGTREIEEENSQRTQSFRKRSNELLIKKIMSLIEEKKGKKRLKKKKKRVHQPSQNWQRINCHEVGKSVGMSSMFDKAIALQKHELSSKIVHFIICASVQNH